jgi:hypothetical protein
MVRVLAGLLCVFAFLSAACGDGDGNDTASPTTSPAATPTQEPRPTTPPEGTPCPVEDSNVCHVAEDLAERMSSEDYDGIVGLARSAEYQCPGRAPTGAGGPFPLCMGAAQGETRVGYSVSRLQSEGAVVTRDGLIALLRRWVTEDAGGTPIRAAAVGCPIIADEAECSDRFAVVLVGEGGSFLLRFGLERAADGTAEIVETIDGIISLNQEMVTGGDSDLPVIFDQLPTPSRYFVLN